MDEPIETVLARLGARRSAWNPADARGEVEKLIAAAGVVTDPGVRGELAEDLTARVVAASRPLLGHADVPEHVRALTSARVLAVERDLVRQITARAEGEAFPAYVRELRGRVGGLDVDQRSAVAHLTGTGRITIVEGAAGAGKTAMLAAARDRLPGPGSPDGRPHPDPKGGHGRRGPDRRRVLSGGVAAVPARVPLGRRRPLGTGPQPTRTWLRGCAPTTWSWSTRRACWTRTPPAPSWPWPPRPGFGSGWSATGTSFRPSAAGECSTWPSATPPTEPSPWTGCAASPTRPTRTCRCGCAAPNSQARCSTSCPARPGRGACQRGRTPAGAGRPGEPGRTGGRRHPRPSRRGSTAWPTSSA